MSRTSIEWTGVTWNPCAGCSFCSIGCCCCYALRMAHRLETMGHAKYQGTTAKVNGKLRWTGKIVLDETALDQPRRWRDPRTVFVDSMSDLFHEAVPFEFIASVFSVMESCPQHTFQVLTKRAHRLMELAPKLPWPSNVWMGVSVEDEAHTFRIDQLRATGARIKFLSLEPLLGPMAKLKLQDIDWIIVGGESGPGARAVKPEWVRAIRKQCDRGGVAFFFKQWGRLEFNPDPHDPTARQHGGSAKGGRLLDGSTWDQMPGHAIPF